MMRKALRASQVKPFLKPLANEPTPPIKTRPLLAGIGWAFLIIVVACIPLSYVAIPVYEMYDEKGSKTQDALGVVTWMESATGGASLVLTIRSSGNQLIAVSTGTREIEFTWGERVEIGERFNVSYRIGRSGRIYVVKASPASPK